MHPSSTTSTPFSVKDILRIEHQHDYENDFLMTDQVVPMHYQQVHSAPRNCDFYDCVSEVQGKLDTHNLQGEGEIHEQGEMMQ